MMMLAGSAAAVLAGSMAGQAMAQPAAANTPATAPAAVPGNILLGDWTGAFGGVPPWDKIRPALFPEAFQFGIDEQRREYLAIANNPAPPTFANTIEAMEKAGQRLGRVQAVFGVYDSNLSSPEVQAIDKEWSPKLTAANDEIILNRPLFQRVETLYTNRASLNLDAKQTRLLVELRTVAHEKFVGALERSSTSSRRRSSAKSTSSSPPLSRSSTSDCWPTRRRTPPRTKPR
jgi:peptidyl-dipeptidase Dcp